ncbi:MAG: prepilin-type N-terminal cleavage/methylation domain-containing protein, partial [Thermoanaerobaculia bacterium]
MRLKTERGMTLVEALVALAITAMIVASSATLITRALRSTRDNMNRQFATQKAVSMLEELRALIQTQNGATTVVLDDYDDGTTNQTLLTTQRGITDPADPASGNRRTPVGEWLFERRITVQRIRGANDLRVVNVKVFVRETSGTRLLAEVAGVLSTIGQNMPPTQVYDVYLIAIENVPGWWLYMQNIVPFVEGAMQDLESRHPGLLFRKHWIRKLSYGRDPYYTPYVNKTADSTQPIPWVYFYPGLLPEGSAVENYYPPDFFNARISVDGAVTNANSYSLADQYNHGMRYLDERALFDARVAAGQENADTPTFRLLLDDMILNPSRYRNAIVINLHGELFPFPPVRNYSDAAKDPVAYPYVRAVTHPERLRSGSADPLTLRVYTYHTNVDNPAVMPDWLGKDGAAVPIRVTLRNVVWTPGSGGVVAITGGVDFDGDGENDDYSAGNASQSISNTI